ncbi:hypothetical protein [Porphyromonas sp.]|uniref:hypothetical protein n=1 Tax=Porphyromonas sp. TaxID=1924944 RepID=UPI0026DB9677|nr:hypothetical protein [Porphyromonas sp.]MDO4771209.1 hypothetical protein [Porphyromonas sp.]
MKKATFITFFALAVLLLLPSCKKKSPELSYRRYHIGIYYSVEGLKVRRYEDVKGSWAIGMIRGQQVTIDSNPKLFTEYALAHGEKGEEKIYSAFPTSMAPTNIKLITITQNGKDISSHFTLTCTTEKHRIFKTDENQIEKNLAEVTLEDYGWLNHSEFYINVVKDFSLPFEGLILNMTLKEGKVISVPLKVGPLDAEER